MFTHTGETSKFPDFKETRNCRVSKGELPGCGAAWERRLCVSVFLEELCARCTGGPQGWGGGHAGQPWGLSQGLPCKVTGRSRKATRFSRTNRLTPVVEKVTLWDPHGQAWRLGAAGAPVSLMGLEQRGRGGYLGPFLAETCRQLCYGLS